MNVAKGRRLQSTNRNANPRGQGRAPRAYLPAPPARAIASASQIPAPTAHIEEVVEPDPMAMMRELQKGQLALQKTIAGLVAPKRQDFQ